MELQTDMSEQLNYHHLLNSFQSTAKQLRKAVCSLTFFKGCGYNSEERALGQCLSNVNGHLSLVGSERGDSRFGMQFAVSGARDSESLGRLVEM